MSSTVLITCVLCKKLYIRETGRRLGDRFREHLRDVEKDDKNASKPVARHFNLPNHSKQHMAVCGILHQGSKESRKTPEQKFIFQIGTLNPHGINDAFHSTYLFCVFHVTRHQPIAQLHLSVNKPHTTHNSSIRSDEGLTLERSASESPYGGQFTLSTQLIELNYLLILPPTPTHSFVRNLPPSL